MGLSRDNILSANDLPSEKVPVPEWGGDVFIRTMTGTERDAWEADITIEGKGGKRQVTSENIRAKLIVRTAVDDVGKRLFTDDDADALGAKSAGALTRLFNVASKLNGLSGAEVDELSKNS